MSNGISRWANTVMFFILWFGCFYYTQFSPVLFRYNSIVSRYMVWSISYNLSKCFHMYLTLAVRSNYPKQHKITLIITRKQLYTKWMKFMSNSVSHQGKPIIQYIMFIPIESYIFFCCSTNQIVSNIYFSLVIFLVYYS